MDCFLFNQIQQKLSGKYSYVQSNESYITSAHDCIICFGFTIFRQISRIRWNTEGLNSCNKILVILSAPINQSLVAFHNWSILPVICYSVNLVCINYWPANQANITNRKINWKFRWCWNSPFGQRLYSDFTLIWDCLTIFIPNICRKFRQSNLLLMFIPRKVQWKQPSWIIQKVKIINN